MLHSNRLYDLRKTKNLSRAGLARLSKVSIRTIQRLENPANGTNNPHGNTLDRLARALQVEPGVLTGDLPLPDSSNALASEPRRVQVSAEIAPKARLAYDLVKRRYDVSTTEIINMAPLFFALLAEGSLARRRKGLEEAGEAISRLDQMADEVGHWVFGRATTVAINADTAERESIKKADLFGEHLFSDAYDAFVDEPFDPAVGNPFASYLSRLAADLDNRAVIEIQDGSLHYGTPWARFPDYHLCDADLDKVTNGSADARRALEAGCVRLSEIPKEVMGEDAGEERAAWLEERLPDLYKDLEEGQPMAEWVKFQATATPAEAREVVKKLASRGDEGGAEEEGDAR